MNLLSKMNLPVTRILKSALPALIALAATTTNSFAVTIYGSVVSSDAINGWTTLDYSEELFSSTRGPDTRSDYYVITGDGVTPVIITFGPEYDGMATLRGPDGVQVDNFSYLPTAGSSRRPLSYVMKSGQTYTLEVRNVPMNTLQYTSFPAAHQLPDSDAYSFQINNHKSIAQIASLTATTSFLSLQTWPDRWAVPTTPPSTPPSTSTEPKQRIVLLLHGLQDTPQRCWSSFMGGRSGATMGIIYGGYILNEATPDDSDVLYYAVDFGAYDKDPTARKGLDDKTNIPATATVASSDDSQNSGDFELLDSPKGLTGEVKDAIAKLLQKFPGGVEVALIGHSRGGLVARAFLQNTSMNGPEKSSVRAMLTVGSPNKGCPVARLHSYAASSSPKSDYYTWKIGAYIKSQGLDTLRPTVSDLRPESPVIANINHPNNLAKMPGTVVYGTLAYTSVDMGFLRLGYFSYSLMPDAKDFFTDPADNISQPAANFILGNQTASSLSGDGMVSASQQGYRNLLNTNSLAFANFVYHGVINSSKTVVHTDEPFQEADIMAALNKMIPWWGDDFNGLDALRYVASYPDLISEIGVNKVKAEEHYLKYGYYEGRRATFNALQYIASYPDLITVFRLNKMAATRHYIRHYYTEGRRATFNANRYLAKYEDLRKAFGTNTIAATRHFILTGYKEGRTDK